ncbi:unnamed protein product [Knipowitschia caucasica]
MRQANTAIQRERHITPTMDDVIHELNGATVFSKLDLRAGYHQLELHPDSRYITTFSTHKGLRRYKRLNFGISSAAEVFQNTICQTLQGIDGIKNLSDDIIVYGKTQTDHDKSLTTVFQRLINGEKCEFNKSRLEFFGFIFQAGGISADPKKVAAIKEASAPETTTEVKSFLDHKALEVIWNNPRSKPPARIERWGLRLQPYDLKVVYKKVSENPADYMSRHPIPTQIGEHTRAAKVAEEYVNYIAQHATPKAMTLPEIKEATLRDPILQKVSAYIRNQCMAHNL